MVWLLGFQVLNAPSSKKTSYLPSDMRFEMRHFSQEDGINVFLGNHEGRFWGDLLELMASFPIVSMGLVYLPTSEWLIFMVKI